MKTESIFVETAKMFLLNLGKCNKPLVVINQQSTGTVKHLESLIQSEKFGGVASTDSENATLANGRQLCIPHAIKHTCYPTV